jgi:hypothetical protein
MLILFILHFLHFSFFGLGSGITSSPEFPVKIYPTAKIIEIKAFLAQHVG